MKCNRCGETGVHNIVLGKEFYYCRTCKDEVSLEEAPRDDMETFETLRISDSVVTTTGWYNVTVDANAPVLTTPSGYWAWDTQKQAAVWRPYK